MKVLVVDDNQVNRYLLEQEFKARGFAVQSAPNGLEALLSLQESPVELIISDILMPEMDGFQLCYALKRDARLNEIPFILYTATYTDAEDEALGLKLGAEAYIPKTADPESLFRQIEATLERGKRGGFKTKSLLSADDEVGFLKQYSARVVRKLEKKILETESALEERNNVVRQLELARSQLASHAEDLERQVAQRTDALSRTVSDLEAFAYGMSHDLRAPLRAIQLYASLVKEKLKDCTDKELLDMIDRIFRSGARMDVLATSVLAFSRLSNAPVELRPVNVKALVEELVSEYPEFHPPRASVQIQDPLSPVMGHKAFLTQCVSNLLGNAVKFVRPNVQPIVKVWTEPRSEQPRSQVRLWVEDNGIGIDPAYQDRLFTMFERVHQGGQFEGNGLGLALVRKAAERMGGRVGVESKLGEGSRFWIQLRVAPDSVM